MPSDIARDNDRLTSTFAERWFRWRRRRGAVAELASLDQDQRNEIARDTGVASGELVTLTRKGPGAADLLYRRLGALGLDKEKIAQDEPAVLKDLQRLCSLCESKGRCMHDLDRDPNDAAWRAYCPNASTLTALRAEADQQR
jgi:hypothetical protein